MPREVIKMLSYTTLKNSKGSSRDLGDPLDMHSHCPEELPTGRDNIRLDLNQRTWKQEQFTCAKLVASPFLAFRAVCSGESEESSPVKPLAAPPHIASHPH